MRFRVKKISVLKTSEDSSEGIKIYLFWQYMTLHLFLQHQHISTKRENKSHKKFLE